MAFELKDLLTIPEIEKKYNISRQILHSRLKHLTEGVDYRKLGIRMPIILTPDGVEKLINVNK